MNWTQCGFGSPPHNLVLELPLINLCFLCSSLELTKAVNLKLFLSNRNIIATGMTKAVLENEHCVPPLKMTAGAELQTSVSESR